MVIENANTRSSARPIIGITYSPRILDVFYHWRYMFDGVVEAGGVPFAIACDSPVENIESLVGRLDGLILSGGGDVDPSMYGADPNDPKLWGVDPIRDANETAAYSAARDAGIPVLAICRGSQFLTALFGGDLYVDIKRDFGESVVHRGKEVELASPRHSVELSPTSELAEWMGGDGEVMVNSQHHQGIKTLPAEFRAVGYSADGLIEAFEWPEAKTVAVQWHPEVVWRADEKNLSLLRGFIAKAAPRT